MTTATELGDGMMVEVMLPTRCVISEEELPEKTAIRTGLVDCWRERRYLLLLLKGLDSEQVTFTTMVLGRARAVCKDPLKISSRAGLQDGKTLPEIRVSP